MFEPQVLRLRMTICYAIVLNTLFHSSRLALGQRVKITKYISTWAGGIQSGMLHGCVMPKMIPPILRFEAYLERSICFEGALHRPRQPIEIGAPPARYHLVRVRQRAVGSISPLYLVHLSPIPSPFVVFSMEALPIVVREYGHPLHSVLMPPIEIDCPRHTELARFDLLCGRFE